MFGTAGTESVYIIKDTFSLCGLDLECLPCFKVRDQGSGGGSVGKAIQA